MSNEFSFLGYSKEVIDEMVRYHLGELIFSAFVGAAVYGSHRYTAWRVLHSGNLGGPSAVIQTTLYDPAYRKNGKGQLEMLINPETGNVFRDQKIRTETGQINLGAIFDKKISGDLVKYFNKAAKLASNDSPIVYLHLDDVLPKKDAKNIHEMIRNAMQNYISGSYRKTEMFLSGDLKPNELRETKKVLPVLVREDGAIGWQLRILLLNLNDEGCIDLPDPRDVRYLMRDGSYEPGTKSVEIDRFKTMTRIQKALNNPETKAALSEYAVEIPTGRVLTLVAPPLASPTPAAAL